MRSLSAQSRPPEVHFERPKLRRKVYHEVEADLQFMFVAEESFAASIAGLLFFRFNDRVDKLFVASETEDRFAIA